VAARFTELIVDSHDPETLARFWGQVLGWRSTGPPEGGVVQIASDDQGPPTIVFVPVGDEKTTKNRLHVDVSPVGCEQEDELARLLALGAVRVDVGQGERPWVVLADPEGNEFCLLRTRVG
jgi:predicted enzyme related to lactoylglutathione lyase